MSDTDAAASYGYCEARIAGRILFCSGQIGIEVDGSVPPDPSRQYELAFAALGEVLRRHGCGAGDIVDLTSFHVGYPAHMDGFIAAKSAFMQGENTCWTAIGVSALGHPGSIVEIKAVALLPHAL